MPSSDPSVKSLERLAGRARGFGLTGMIVAVLLAVAGVIIGEGSGDAETRTLERIGMLLPLAVYTCWWVYIEIATMRMTSDAQHEAATSADAAALEALFNASETATGDVPVPGRAGRPMLIDITDQTRTSYRNSITRPLTDVPNELRPGFRNVS
ncbi:MAG: hypothetical protein H7123_07580 [Thermoleophilia bacterium]|nr:hypothetical protein [Thermoleophilia bacterium]